MIKVSNRNEAWELAYRLMNHNLERDEEASKRAGYTIKRDIDNENNWVSDLNSRLELNFSNGSTLNIYVANISDVEDKEVLHYEKMVKEWADAHNMSTFTGEHTVDRNHIFDEEQSVRWNREQVVKHNEAVNEKRRSLREEKCRCIEQATVNVIKFLANDNSVTYALAEKVFQYVNNNFDNEHKIQHIIDDCEDIINILKD